MLPYVRGVASRCYREDRFVALKILTSEATKALAPGPDQRSDEQPMLEKIACADPSHRGFRHTLAYLDAFNFTGPHGLHRCIVTEPLGYGVDYIRKLRPEGDRRVAPSIVKRVTRQVLLGLEYLHDVCGIVHTGMSRNRGFIRAACAHSIHAKTSNMITSYSAPKTCRPSSCTNSSINRPSRMIAAQRPAPPSSLWSRKASRSRPTRQSTNAASTSCSRTSDTVST